MFTLAAADGIGEDLVFSASDLVVFSECHFGFLRRLDVALGRGKKPEVEADAMLARASKLGYVHEEAVLDDYLARFGPWDPEAGTGVRVVEEIPRDQRGRAAYEQKHAETVEALKAGADVVFQASFFDGRFHGKADFLVKQPDGSYAVYDTKLARHAKTTALLQLASYADQLLDIGISVAPEVTLILGTREESHHAVSDLLPVFREQFGRLLEAAESHRAGGVPVEWFTDGMMVCGSCDYCKEAIGLHDDLYRVAGMRGQRRRQLHEAGVRTVADLAGHEPGSDRFLARLVDQARMQLEAEEQGRPTFRVLAGHCLAAIPKPSPGDIFFDFEGDPMWQDETGEWGIEYLFGVIEAPVGGGDPVFRKFVAHDRAQERRAFLDFVAYVEQRRAQHPGMHVYHYAAYEQTALKRLSHTYPGGEHAVDDWLRNGVLVDLFTVVKRSLRVGAASYSIKKLEPLYMGNDLRAGDVLDAGASVVAYADYCERLEAGKEAEAQAIWQSIEDYNKYDCVSTLRLRDWLLGLALQESAVTDGDAGATDPEPVPPREPSELETAMGDLVAALPDSAERTAEETVLTLVEAALAYHRREKNTEFREHFERLNDDVEEWQDTRNVFLIDELEVLADWSRPGNRGNLRRRIRATGRLADGSRYRLVDERKQKSTYVRIFEEPWPEKLSANPVAARNFRASFGNTEIIAVEAGAEQSATIVFDESDKTGYPELPMALAPAMPIPTNSLEAAIAGLAEQLRRSYPDVPRHAVFELMRRRSPGELFPDALARPVSGDYVPAIVKALKSIEDSYVAVQGPPGTGKTFVGARVIKALAERGWKIGVVAQSHAVVENLLDGVVKAGLDRDLVVKTPDTEGPRLWTVATEKGEFRDLVGRPGPVVAGGTAWSFADPELGVDFDLMVVDEAGQFSLANTMAAAHRSRRILLLGDPNQLPQVSQGRHPAPVNGSALGWLAADHPVLPEEFGYFLERSWRMHPDLCRPVSRLAYGGHLVSAEAAAGRRLEGKPAGVETVLVEHTDRVTASPEEAAEAVAQVRQHLGLAWSAGAGAEPRPLEAGDVLVVAAYNAQVELIREHLDAAGLPETRVGTVDKFQGQEAPVVVVSMACSEPRTASRGMDFLLNRNRINVAVSRAMWRAVLVRSPRLTHYLPKKPHALAELGAFIGLSAP